jgi:hypothetical protein
LLWLGERLDHYIWLLMLRVAKDKVMRVELKPVEGDSYAACASNWRAWLDRYFRRRYGHIFPGLRIARKMTPDGRHVQFFFRIR